MKVSGHKCAQSLESYDPSTKVETKAKIGQALLMKKAPEVAVVTEQPAPHVPVVVPQVVAPPPAQQVPPPSEPSQAFTGFATQRPQEAVSLNIESLADDSFDMMIATQDATTTNSESLGDDSFDMMIATQDALHGSDSGFDSMMQTEDEPMASTSAGPGITAGMQTMTLSYAAREQHIRNKECEERAYKDRLIGKLVDHILKKNI